MSSKGGGQTQTSQVVLPDWLTSAAQGSLANAQTLSQTPYTPNPYATVAPMTADQTAAYDTIRNMQGGTEPAFSAAEGAISGGGLLGEVKPLSASDIAGTATGLMNPYTSAVIDPTVATMNQQLQQNLRQIGANASNVGAFGGSRQGVEEGTAVSQEALGAGQLTGGLLSSGWNQAMGTATDLAKSNLGAGEWATGELPQLATAGQGATAQAAGLLEAAGRAQQGQAQSVLDTSASNFENQIMWPFQMQQMLEQAISATPYGQTTVTTGPAATKNVGASLLGGAASGAAIGSMFGPIGTGVGAAAGGLLSFM